MRLLIAEGRAQKRLGGTLARKSITARIRGARQIAMHDEEQVERKHLFCARQAHEIGIAVRHPAGKDRDAGSRLARGEVNPHGIGCKRDRRSARMPGEPGSARQLRVLVGPGDDGEPRQVELSGLDAVRLAVGAGCIKAVWPDPGRTYHHVAGGRSHAAERDIGNRGGIV